MFSDWETSLVFLVFDCVAPVSRLDALIDFYVGCFFLNTSSIINSDEEKPSYFLRAARQSSRDKYGKFN